MRPVTGTFLSTLRGSHQMVARARLLTTFQVGTNPLDPGVSLPECTLAIRSGDVRCDAAAAVRATLELLAHVATWSPSGPLTPYGPEVFVERGLAYGGGHVEWVSQGYFRLYDIEQQPTTLRLAGRDRMSGIVEARLTTPAQFEPGIAVGSVVDQLVTEVYPDAVIEWDDATEAQTLTRAQVAEEDRYDFLHQLLTSYGKIFYFDHRGYLVIRSAPNPAEAVWEINHGRDGVLIEASRRLSREGVYNAVVASGEGADTEAAARAVVVDNNPRSPTYWHGPFGRVPRFYRSPFLQTDLQAQMAAQALLRQAIGLPHSIDLAAVPNPALEVLDPVRVATSTGAETHILQTTVLPLTADRAATATSREQTLVILGTA